MWPRERLATSAGDWAVLGEPPTANRLHVMRVAFAADDSNECVDAVRKRLKDRAELIEKDASGSWPEMSEAVARAVASGEADYGVLMCWTGTGTAIAANKVPGIRAAQALVGDGAITHSTRSLHS